MDDALISLQQAQVILDNQPFSRLLGTEITRFDDIAELQLALKPEFQQQNGFAHGGVISYLADNALTFAGGMALGPRVLSSEYKIHYLRPGQGDRLIARAQVVHAGRSQAVCRCDVLAQDGSDERLCATALGTIVAIRK